MTKDSVPLRQIDEFRWEIPASGGMRVPGRIYSSEKLLPHLQSDKAPEQCANVAHLPGIVKYSIAMPDIHWGYGFPIGGVAAFDPDEGGVISPGGVGYDINCGVRLIRTDLHRDDLQGKVRSVVTRFFQKVPSGVGSSDAIGRLSKADMRKLVTEGAGYAIDRGFGDAADLEHIEEHGLIEGADPDMVSERAFSRGADQVGTLGSGNHFLEIQYVDEIYDIDLAEDLGLREGTITVSIHCGSRGFGYQVCDDSLAMMGKAASKHGIQLPDRQLACAPLGTPEAKRYLGAMACAANYAFANRQTITQLAKDALLQALDITPRTLGFRVVYDVCHNIAKFERHVVDGQEKRLCVHRKGATRAFGPGHPETPAAYQKTGQPVLIPGDMGRASFVLVGTELAMKETFGSSCHGAGRLLSRKKAAEQSRGRDLFAEMEKAGVIVASQSKKTLAEEMPYAYKDASLVVDVMHGAGLSRKVCRLRPIGVTKG